MNPQELVEIREDLLRRVRDLPSEALTELAHIVLELERLYSKSQPPVQVPAKRHVQ